jgi:hypothetical protein
MALTFLSLALRSSWLIPHLTKIRPSLLSYKWISKQPSCKEHTFLWKQILLWMLLFSHFSITAKSLEKAVIIYCAYLLIFNFYYTQCNLVLVFKTVINFLSLGSPRPPCWETQQRLLRLSLKMCFWLSLS